MSSVQFKIFYGDNFERCKMHRMKKERFELMKPKTTTVPITCTSKFGRKGVNTDCWFCDIKGSSRKPVCEKCHMEGHNRLNNEFGQCLSVAYCNLLDKHTDERKEKASIKRQLKSEEKS